MLSRFLAWLHLDRDTPGALTRMSLGPDKNSENALMIQFFTWESAHTEMSWWKHFECEVPKLAELGVTHVWLPPPNKATSNQGQGYDAYDLGNSIRKGRLARGGVPRTNSWKRFLPRKKTELTSLLMPF